MKIGIDLDGVVFDTEKEFRVYSELFDMLSLKQNSKKNNKELRFQDRFNWSDEQTQSFLDKYHRRIDEEANYVPGAKDVLHLLKKDGHQLVVITARGGWNKEMIDITKRRFYNDDMDIFDKCYWACENKGEVCLKEKIDVMIDDSYEKCKMISEEKIKTIYLKDAPSYEIQDNEYVKTLYNWGEIYRYISELSNKKKS